MAGKCSDGLWRKIAEDCVLLRVEVIGTRGRDIDIRKKSQGYGKENRKDQCGAAAG